MTLFDAMTTARSDELRRSFKRKGAAWKITYHPDVQEFFYFYAEGERGIWTAAAALSCTLRIAGTNEWEMIDTFSTDPAPVIGEQ